MTSTLHSSVWRNSVFLTLTLGGLCLAQVPMLPGWQGSPGAARVVTIQGNVSVIRDTQAWAVMPDTWIQPRQEIITGGDGYALLEVADGSTFEVFPNTRATFRHNPGNLREIIDLWIGRIKVHIQRLNGEPNHNRIRTPTAVISVRGTVFDITVDPVDEVTLVYVEEGSVAVQHALLPYSEAKILQSGDYLRVYRNSPLAQKRFDKGDVLQRALRALSDFVVLQGPRLGRGGASPLPGGGGGGPVLGDTAPTTPPPPPPPPPPGGE